MREEKYRYERKFIVPRLDSKEIEALIKTNAHCFSEIFYGRRINSIYFDTTHMKDYNENVSGVSKRVKYRVRWYGDVLGEIKKPVLEIKMKEGMLGKKLSFPLKEFVLNKKFERGVLEKVFRESKLPPKIRLELKKYFPKIIVSYFRRYYQSFDKRFRITLDEDLVFYNVGGKNNQFKAQTNERLKNILELKYKFKEDFFASEITQEFPFRITASSKYVMGINSFL